MMSLVRMKTGNLQDRRNNTKDHYIQEISRCESLIRSIIYKINKKKCLENFKTSPQYDVQFEDKAAKTN